jgi:ubiquinone/menaquinone biosynthesis C-methylase UbiE
MTQEQIWRRDDTVEMLKSKERRLDLLCPPLRSYLKPGMKVLDVGCGPGPVTLDVAEAVYPGAVVGVDFSASSITQAQAAAEAAQCKNITFQVGDTYQLDFADETFDLVYSTNLLGWLREPVQALAEQRRVTKRGGWVFAQLGDYGNIIFYPPCPALDQYLAALARFRHLGDSEAHIDSHQARRAVELLSQAGLTELQIEGWVENIYRGKEGFEETYTAWREFWLSMDNLVATLNRKLMAAGLLDAKTLLAAQSEIEQWHSYPYALYTQTECLAGGRA